MLLIQDGDTLLLGKRKNCYGAGTWGLPGGHLEFNERMIDAAIREAQEELGLVIRADQLQLAAIHDGVVDDATRQAGGGHHVQFGFTYTGPSVTPENMEPDRCEALQFFPFDELPALILRSHKPVIDMFLQQRLYLN